MYPGQLSGGMQQRVGIARALSIGPDLLLMDEPFSHLDAITARDLRVELQRLWLETRSTILFVTHDVMEAVLLSSRVIMMSSQGIVFRDIGDRSAVPPQADRQGGRDLAGRDPRAVRGDGAPPDGRRLRRRPAPARPPPTTGGPPCYDTPRSSCSRKATVSEEMRWMQKGSAFMRFTAAGPVAIDFGQDLFGGSTLLYETKPWERTPRWRAATAGPPCELRRRAAPGLRGPGRIEGLQQRRRPPRDRGVQRRGSAKASSRRGSTGGTTAAPDRARTRAARRDVHLEGRRRRRDEGAGARRREAARPTSPGSRSSHRHHVGGLATDWTGSSTCSFPTRTPRNVPRERGLPGHDAVVAAATKHEWTARMTHLMHGH